MNRNDQINVLVRGKWHTADYIAACPEAHAHRVKIYGEEWTVRDCEVFSEAGKSIKRLELFEAQHKEMLEALTRCPTMIEYARNKAISYHWVLRTMARHRHLKSLCPSNAQKDLITS